MKKTSALSSVVGASLLMCGDASAQIFSGDVGLMTIEDGGQTAGGPAEWGPALMVTFNVGNGSLSGAIADMSLSITMDHSYIGDLDVQLFAPGSHPEVPTAQGFVIFSRVGQVTSTIANNEGNTSYALGSPARFGTYGFDQYGAPSLIRPETYVFSDSASRDLWEEAKFRISDGVSNFANAGDIMPGSFRTSVAGPWDSASNPTDGNVNAGRLTSFGNSSTFGTSGFIGMTPQQAEGTWTLRFRDGSLGDTGEVTRAELTITPVPEPIQYALLTGLGLIAFAGYRRYSLAKA